MEILLAHFKINNFGGIINYSEQLARGLKELRHNVDSIMLKNTGKSGYPPKKDRSDDPRWEYGEGLGLWHNQQSGWEGMFQLNYRKDLDELAWVDEYDLVIYIVPVPTASKLTKDDSNWMKLFDNELLTQIAIIHDGNMQKMYPHILHICDKLEGVVCVHDTAYNSCDVLPVRHKLIPNPHSVDKQDLLHSHLRAKGFVSLQTFKRWKRVDDLIRAVPHMDFWTEKVICGGGIEHNYMTSKDKCKPEYFNEKGERIWDVALENGMWFRGYVSTEVRDKMLSTYRLLIDPSWSKNYSEKGSHFNRVMVEAMVKGCVPVCTDLAMKGASLFKKNVNYLEIPYDTPPIKYGEQLEAWLDDVELLHKIQDANFKLIEKFDRKKIAQDILDFAFNPKTGVIGKTTEKFRADAAKKMLHFDDLYSG